jgi:hypothetical protein
MKTTTEILIAFANIELSLMAVKAQSFLTTCDDGTVQKNWNNVHAMGHDFDEVLDDITYHQCESMTLYDVVFDIKKRVSCLPSYLNAAFKAGQCDYAIGVLELDCE